MTIDAQPLHKVACVDADWADRRAHSVDRTGLDNWVFALSGQLARERMVANRRGMRLFAPNGDPLSGRQCQVSARTHRLAEAAIDASIYLGLNS